MVLRDSRHSGTEIAYGATTRDSVGHSSITCTAMAYGATTHISLASYRTKLVYGGIMLGLVHSGMMLG
eukprot:2384161-Rhodomonas_salina.1